MFPYEFLISSSTLSPILLFNPRISYVPFSIAISFSDFGIFPDSKCNDKSVLTLSFTFPIQISEGLLLSTSQIPLIIPAFSSTN